MKLSKKNYNKLNENFLYERPPIVDNRFSVGTTSGTYHCKNWTFTVVKRENRAFMQDTYFGRTYEEVTDENFNLYKKIFDFREVRKIGDYEINEYNKDDLFCVATDSGGYSCGHIHWVKKNAKKSKELLIDKSKKKIDNLKRDLDWETRELEKYIDGTHYKFD